jgi:hypothetical protein
LNALMVREDGECEEVSRVTEKPQAAFAIFMRHAQHSAWVQWWLCSVLRGLIASGAVLIALTAVGTSAWTRGMACAAVGALAMTANLWATRGLVTRLAETIDVALAAEGRVIAAAEFLSQAPEDSFKQLAVMEAGSWISGRAEALDLWRMPRELYLFPAVAAACAGCLWWL